MSVHKLISTVATIVVIMVLIVVAVIYRDDIAGLWTVSDQDEITIYVGSKSFNVTVANTPESRQQGLSNTEKLQDFEGKLFIFDREDIHGIWMKDMNYALDILWFNADRELVHIEEGVTPESYTRNRTIFRPTRPALYVLEVNAGTVSVLDISASDRIEIPPNLTAAE